jgi:Mrp family chromosome partitioning ATPase
MSKSKKTNLPATSFTEVNRLHHRAVLDSKKQVVVMTSSTGGEGVTTLAHIMATRAADAGTKTLLVDLNLKNTGLTTLLGMKSCTWDIAHRGQHDPLVNAARAVEGVPHLHLLPAPDDLESVTYLRDGKRAREVFNDLLQHYDYVLVDTTPIDAMNRQNADAVLLAAAADDTILVLLAGRTPSRLVQKAVQQLQAAGARLSGVLVNDLHNPPLQISLMRLIDRLAWLNDDFRRWLRQKVMQCTWLES